DAVDRVIVVRDLARVPRLLVVAGVDGGRRRRRRDRRPTGQDPARSRGTLTGEAVLLASDGAGIPRVLSRARLDGVRGSTRLALHAGLGKPPGSLGGGADEARVRRAAWVLRAPRGRDGDRRAHLAAADDLGAGPSGECEHHESRGRNRHGAPGRVPARGWLRRFSAVAEICHDLLLAACLTPSRVLVGNLLIRAVAAVFNLSRPETPRR